MSMICVCVCVCMYVCMRTIWKVRGLTLLLRVGTLWRCGDGLFFEVSPLASDALLTTLHPLLEIVLQTVDHFEISCLGALFSWLKKSRNHMGRDLNWILCSAWKTWIGGTPLEHPPYSPDLTPIRATCPTHVMLLGMFAQTIFGEAYKLWSPPLCNVPNIIKLSRAVSRVKWLNGGEKKKISKTLRTRTETVFETAGSQRELFTLSRRESTRSYNISTCFKIAVIFLDPDLCCH
jgi:hypothetical protein